MNDVKKIFNYFITGIFICTAYLGFSQDKIDTVYIKYPSARKNVVKDSASYYRVRTISNGILKAEDYSMKDNVLQCSGYYKSFDPYILHGAFIDYSPNENGMLSVARIEGNYVNDEKEGVWKYYRCGGELWYTITYMKGLKNGMLKSYYQTGEVKRIEQYKKGKLVQTQCYTRDGKDTVCYGGMFIWPRFPEGNEARQNYIMGHIIYPEQAKKDKIEGTVYVMYIVNTDGSISDVEVVKGKEVDPLLDQAAVDCIKHMPAMIPGSIDGTPVKVKMVQRITFSLTQ